MERRQGWINLKQLDHVFLDWPALQDQTQETPKILSTMNLGANQVSTHPKCTEEFPEHFA